MTRLVERAALVAWLALPACWAAPPSREGAANAHARLEVGAARLSGDLGRLRGFSGSVWLMDARHNGYTSNVELGGCDSATGWAITMDFAFYRGLANERLAPGTSSRYDTEASDVLVLGRSGPSESSIDFCRRADRLGIQVREGSEPDTRTLEFEATWLDAQPQTVRGSLDYRFVVDPATTSGEPSPDESDVQPQP